MSPGAAVKAYLESWRAIIDHFQQTVILILNSIQRRGPRCLLPIAPSAIALSIFPKGDPGMLAFGNDPLQGISRNLGKDYHSPIRMDKRLDAIAGFKMEVLSDRFWYRSVASDAEYGFHDPVLPFNEAILFANW